MKRALLVIGLAVLAAAGAVANAAERSHFRHYAKIEGQPVPGRPVRLPLPAELISRTTGSFSDLRLFDGAGQETPYVIYTQRERGQTSHTFAFKIKAFEEKDGVAEIVLTRPGSVGPYWRLELHTSAKDFKKSVRVLTSVDGKAWTNVASDTIFDFSSRVPLRKTTIDLPGVDAAYLKLVFEESPAPKNEKPEIRLRYEGLEFSATGAKGAPFRITRITARTGKSRPLTEFYDRVRRGVVETRIDKQKNTVILLGRVNLPVAKLTLAVENPYYYRRVEIWSAAEEKDEAYRQVASGTVFKVPGMKASRNTLRLDLPQQRFLRLKVINGDNPPLRVRHVEIAWVRRNLYFIPEASQSYTAYFGGESIRSPQYELGNLIPADHRKLKHYQQVALGAVRENAAYAPPPPPEASRREATEKALFIGIVIILVCGMSFWLYRLMKKIPVASGGRD